MSRPNHHEILRAIPPVDAILAHPTVAGLQSAYPRFPWTALVRAVLDDFRAAPPALDSTARAAVTEWVARELEARVAELRGGGLRRVLNGTGVVLHTNLGRAVVSDAAADAAREALVRYVALEVDLDSGQRSRRGETLADLICLATGGEACMVVNNNAAAVLLVVSTFSPPGRVIVSRGELVEIGGSFRLPEILAHGAGEVVEVGTTNRTYAEDYRRVARAGDVILKVHKSNYAIEGFAHEATIDELAAVAADTGGRLVYDLGSGAVFDFAGAGAGEDPAVADIVARGVDCVTMSGDKLLGGSQAGIIVGRREVVDALKQNPLRRAVRVDKVTIAVLQEVMRSYLFAPAVGEAVPVVGQVLAAKDELARRAAAIVARIDGAAARGVGVVDDDAAVGGGSLSTVTVPAVAVAVRCAGEREALALARALRRATPPVFTRIKGAEVRVNLATIRPDEDDELAGLLDAAIPRPEDG